MEKQLIYIVEDEQNIRELNSYALEKEGYEIKAFENAEAMMEACEKTLPKLILLDIMLPSMDGLETTRILRQRYPNVFLRIILLSAKGSEVNKVQGLEAGADDYIVKPYSVLEMVARVKANLRKYAVDIDSDVLVLGDLTMNLAAREVKLDKEIIKLTGKEFDIFKVLLQNAGTVIEREKLFKEVWNEEYFGETRTLDIHINTLRKKLGEYGENIIMIRGIGYSLKKS
ncbi:MAG: response regulator transcription factor [Firmicutes bacterium]|nr:response regulator transcription factor [Bacillota bacterium]